VDFGYRGCSSVESAGIGGCAHLVNFTSTDTLAALDVAHQYYGEEVAGFSIPATEHSTMTSWGRDGESAAVRSLLEKIPEGYLAIVSDSYDLFNMVEHILGEELKDKIESRKGCIVVRPDSGDPATMVLNTLNILGKKFGQKENSKGYKMLPSCISVIQGDGICYESIGSILSTMKENGWSADNVVFGSGGALLQRLDRDTQKCAYKCSYVVVDGEGRDVYKDPVTDPGKKSKRGRQVLIKKDGEFKTVRQEDTSQDDEMYTVFENGELTTEWTFDQIRTRSQQNLTKC